MSLVASIIYRINSVFIKISSAFIHRTIIKTISSSHTSIKTCLTKVNMKRTCNAESITIPALKLRYRIIVIEAEWQTKHRCGAQKENKSLGNKSTQPQSTKVLTEEFKSQIEQKNLVSKQCWGKYRRKGQRGISLTLHKNHLKCVYGLQYNTWNHETTALLLLLLLLLKTKTSRNMYREGRTF